MPTSSSFFTSQKPKRFPSTSSSPLSPPPLNQSIFDFKYDHTSDIMSKSTFNPELTTSFASSPVVIPTRGHHDGFGFDPRKDRRQSTKRHSSTRSSRRSHDVYSPDAVPPSVAALLAITTIPPPKSKKSVRRRGTSRQRLTVDAILRHTAVSEKELSVTFGMSPMELLLSPPEEIDSTDCCSESGPGSVLSSRTTSSDSAPSLDDGSLSDASTTPGSIITPSSRGRRSLPTRRYQPTFSGECTLHDHPLSDVDVEELDFRVFQITSDLTKDQQPVTGVETPRRKSAFKSNLTASLRALKSAAKSFSSLTTPMITPDDFLTRSIMSIDPKVPFTDERMPPLLLDTPTPALRRYLNPTTNAPIDAHVPASLSQTMSAPQCTASIQMQTYKVSKSPKGSSPTGLHRRRQGNSEQAFAEVASGPVARQRDMRENSDFIRIAVMEMAMRKNGKLDDRKPGRAKWALPPRQAPSKPYEIGDDGVPLRWTALTYSTE
ncbi:hypothetical protein DSL72_009311 [Monilinia vaccinii-corymbosi]|uniref:Uncharacterized protein n=1 Tax=Monilinia vaccinii-corymbosi TaxID=61207 RepID=A0A8A3PP09_9HELO|nr:hypothetical protein DSL72_009311 [Monilinia vaccinii-corymbosi]